MDRYNNNECCYASKYMKKLDVHDKELTTLSQLKLNLILLFPQLKITITFHNLQTAKNYSYLKVMDRN